MSYYNKPDYTSDKILKKPDDEHESFVEPLNYDGSNQRTVTGKSVSLNFDVSGMNFQNEKELVKQYREVAIHPIVHMAVEEIINEFVNSSDTGIDVDLDLDNFDKLENPNIESLKEEFYSSFDKILDLLEFTSKGNDLVKKWYIDARLFFYKVYDPKNKKKGLQKLEYIDPLDITKERIVVKDQDPSTGKETIKDVVEYYVYCPSNSYTTFSSYSGSKLVIEKELITYVTSGEITNSVNNDKKYVISYLHKVLKPLKNLILIEDSQVVNTLVRGPMRRVFSVDVGNKRGQEAQNFLETMSSTYRNRISYDSKSGSLSDQKQAFAITEDFWLPQSPDGKGTKIETLEGQSNLMNSDQISYYQKNVYLALDIPMSRFSSETPFNFGRTTEISRDEVKFKKFIDKLRRRFSDLFLELLRDDLILRGIISFEEWDVLKGKIRFRFMNDNHFQELKEIEVKRERVNLLQEYYPYMGRLISREWLYKNVLRLTDDEIAEEQRRMEQEIKEDPTLDPNYIPPEMLDNNCGNNSNSSPKPKKNKTNQVKSKEKDGKEPDKSI